MIQVTAIGRLGTDGVARQAGQSNVVSFSLAAEKSQKDQQTGKYPVDWYSVDVFGKLGETLAPYLKKGQMVAVFGRLEIQTFTRADGTAGSKPTINAREIKLIGDKPPQQQAVQQQLPVQQQRAVAPPAVQQSGAPTQADLDAIFGSDEQIPF